MSENDILPAAILFQFRNDSYINMNVQQTIGPIAVTLFLPIKLQHSVRHLL